MADASALHGATVMRIRYCIVHVERINHSSQRNGLPESKTKKPEAQQNCRTSGFIAPYNPVRFNAQKTIVSVGTTAVGTYSLQAASTYC
ncbi:hypothetical protein [Woeseia oceani]|uniref:hypothetical protein n=1 Tax=Woeseia oceani TaxID=1548547 RepID=UPI0018D2993E|nr:hypothetical protein [Woeseia oceani]